MSEVGTMRRAVINGLRACDAVSVENPAHPGTPDVNCTVGWLELKWLRSWPKNCDKDAVLFDHYTPQQKVWHRRRWLRGGSVWLLLQVQREWLLFDGLTAAAAVGKVTRPTLREIAHHRWTNGMQWNELAAIMAERQLEGLS